MNIGLKRIDTLRVGDVVELRDAAQFSGLEWSQWGRAIVVAPWREDRGREELTLAAYDPHSDSVYVYGVYNHYDRRRAAERLAICSGAHYVQIRRVAALELDAASLETLVALAPGFAGTLDGLVEASVLLEVPA